MAAGRPLTHLLARSRLVAVGDARPAADWRPVIRALALAAAAAIAFGLHQPDADLQPRLAGLPVQ